MISKNIIFPGDGNLFPYHSLKNKKKNNSTIKEKKKNYDYG